MIGEHLPILIPASALLATLVAAGCGERRATGAFWVAWAGTLVALGLSVEGLVRAATEGPIRYHLGGWAPPIGIELVLDALSAFLCVVISGVAFVVLAHSRKVGPRELEGRLTPFYAAAMLLLTGLLGIVLTGDLFNLYVFLEISSLAMYALLAVGDRRAPVSAFRYLILGTAGASFYLLGIAFIFMLTGSLNMADVAAILPHALESPTITVALILIALGIALKMALFPLHTWMPDAYTHASSPAAALIAPIGTKVAAYVLIRFFFYVVEPDHTRVTLPLMDVVGYLGAIGIVWGSVMAIAQDELKRMLAYSSVAQAGYLAVGIGLASPLGMIGAVLHVLNHACMKACLFMVAGTFRRELGHSQVSRLDPSVRRAYPWTCAAFAVAAISMIGLPPLAGFFSKWYLALGSLEQGRWVFLAALLLSTLLSAVYFFRVLERLYLIRSEEALSPAGALPRVMPSPELEPAPSLDETLRLSPAWHALPTVIMAASLLALGLLNAWVVESFIRPMLPPGL
jgi:multicomponent Na+:H+ antiporter subunit D